MGVAFFGKTMCSVAYEAPRLGNCPVSLVGVSFTWVWLDLVIGLLVGLCLHDSSVSGFGRGTEPLEVK